MPLAPPVTSATFSIKLIIAILSCSHAKSTLAQHNYNINKQQQAVNKLILCA